MRTAASSGHGSSLVAQTSPGVPRTPRTAPPKGAPHREHLRARGSEEQNLQKYFNSKDCVDPGPPSMKQAVGVGRGLDPSDHPQRHPPTTHHQVQPRARHRAVHKWSVEGEGETEAQGSQVPLSRPRSRKGSGRGPRAPPLPRTHPHRTPRDGGGGSWHRSGTTRTWGPRAGGTPSAAPSRPRSKWGALATQGCSPGGWAGEGQPQDFAELTAVAGTPLPLPGNCPPPPTRQEQH